MLNGCLPPPILPHLNYQSILNYRQSYREYRLGHWRGARGEIDKVINSDLNNLSSDLYSHSSNKKRKRIFAKENEGEGSEETETIKKYESLDNLNDFNTLDEFSFTEEDEKKSKNESCYEKDTKAFQLLSTWRIHYRKFRQGHAHGAEGNLEVIAKKLTLNHLSYLPVCQLKEWLVSEEKRKKEEKEKTEKVDIVREIKEKDIIEDKEKVNFHLHFGAGKLGLGLIIPFIVKSKQPFAILQSYSDSWENFMPKRRKIDENTEKEVITLKINRKTLCKLKLFNPNFNTVEQLLDKFSNHDETVGWFIFDVDESLIMKIISKASSFSCALGSGVSDYLFNILCKLEPKEDECRPILYACENDQKSIEDLAKRVVGKVDVVTCMVDRICSNRHIDFYNIEVLTEPYEGEIVILNLPQRQTVPCCPFVGDNIQIPKLNAEAKYFSQRKILIVNGMHTTLAFMTLCKYAKNDSLKNYELINLSTCSEKEKRQIWGWIVTRCLLLLFQHDISIIKAAHGVTSDEEVIDILLSYARNVLHRFSTIKDTTGRVLSGGIANRYETRLKNVQEFIDAAGPTLMPIGSLLLKKAGIGSCELGFIIFSLVEKAKRFVEMPTGSKIGDKDESKDETAGNVKEGSVESEEKSKYDKNIKNNPKNNEQDIVGILGVSNPIQLFKNHCRNLNT